MDPLFTYWAWWIVAVVLLLAELLAPALFALWLAIAAAAVGVIVFFVPLSWEIQLLLFSILSVIFVIVARPWLLARRAATDRPNLHQRHRNYIGREFVLDRAIAHGRGKLRIDDTYWDITGPDLAKGTRIKVVGVDDLTLKVEPAQEKT